MGAAKSEARTLTIRQQKGRAVNAIAELLDRRLAVPKIYLEPNSHYIAADVFAVDRAGAGDLHAAVIKIEQDFRMRSLRKGSDLKAQNQPNNQLWQVHLPKKIREIHHDLMLLPVHFRYLAVPQASLDAVMGEIGPVLYPRDGIGRIGIISLTDRGEELPIADIYIAPERFRVDAATLTKIEKTLINNKRIRPDIEVRI